MQKIIFTGLESDPLVRAAFAILQTNEKTREGVIIKPLEESGPVLDGSFGIFSSNGKFPSRFIRVVRPTDVSRNIEIPDWTGHVQNAYALDRARETLILAQHGDFIHALYQLYLKLRPRADESCCKQVTPRGEWKTGFHARRRQEAPRDRYMIE